MYMHINYYVILYIMIFVQIRPQELPGTARNCQELPPAPSASGISLLKTTPPIQPTKCGHGKPWQVNL